MKRKSQPDRNIRTNGRSRDMRKDVCIEAGVMKFTNHSKRVLKHAMAVGWRPGARYTNLRDIRGTEFRARGFLDIDWKNYDLSSHMAAAAKLRPLVTVARDVQCASALDSILLEAEGLAKVATVVVIVPKCKKLQGRLDEYIPREYRIGFSVPTKYGKTEVDPESVTRPVHLLGGRPDTQRKLANLMPVESIDCNRFTLDASFGDYFDGETFRPHPIGGYDRCITDSLININAIWADYRY